jgi:hypothetical protein
MRQAFVHEAIVVMPPDADTRAPGAAITVELCGHWEHEPPCPLAPHHTTAERVAGEVLLRTLFAAEPSAEEVVRQRIESALSRGRLAGPDGTATSWELRTSRPSEVTTGEADHAARLASEPPGAARTQ